MGEEVKMSDYEIRTNGGKEDGSGNEEERVLEWEVGLPSADDLTPLSQLLIPPELASAFSISPEPYLTLLDVNRASQTTLSNLCSHLNALSPNNFKSFAKIRTRDPMDIEGNNNNNNNDNDDNIGNGDNLVDPGRVEGSGNKLRRTDLEEADSALRTENSGDDPSARTVKRPRLVWTPQLHERFVDVVARLGIKNAVPKTIMQLMNVEGLTRENVASHLQKYRLYLKRMQGGLSTEGPSSSDQLFASTPVPQSLHENGGGGGNGHLGEPMPVPYHGPMMPIPMYGNHHLHKKMGNNNHHRYWHHHHQQFDGNLPYNNMLQQRDWSGTDNHGSVVSYPHHHHHPHPHHVAPHDM